jgi:hypothetical protein
MLALLVDRTLQQALRRNEVSAHLAFELLEPCRLTAHQTSARSRPTYVLTHPTDEQMALLRRLRLGHLVDERELAAALTPRGVFCAYGR